MTQTRMNCGAREPSHAPDNDAVGSPPRFGLRRWLLALVAAVGMVAAACEIGRAHV